MLLAGVDVVTVQVNDVPIAGADIMELAGRPAVGMRALMRVAAGCGLAGSHPLRVSLEHARISTPIGLHLQGSIAVGGSADEQQGEEEGSIALGMEEPADLSRLQVSATSDTGGRKPDAQGDKKRDVVASLYLSPWALPLESHWALPPCASTLSSCCQHADALAPGNKG